MTEQDRYPIRVEQGVSRTVAAVRTRLPVSEVPRRFGEFLGQVYAASGPSLSLDGQNIFVYHGAEGADGLTAVDFAVGVTAPFVAEGAVQPVMLPVGTVAATTHRGDYGGLRDAHRAVIDWCTAQAHARTGVRWEVYGHWSDDPAQLRTDVYHQLATTPGE